MAPWVENVGKPSKSISQSSVSPLKWTFGICRPHFTLEWSNGLSLCFQLPLKADGDLLKGDKAEEDGAEGNGPKCKVQTAHSVHCPTHPIWGCLVLTHTYLHGWWMLHGWVKQWQSLPVSWPNWMHSSWSIYEKKPKTGRLHNAYSLYRLSHFIPSPFYKSDFPMPKLAMVQASIDLPDADWICYPKNQTYFP